MVETQNCLFCDFVSGKWKKHKNKFKFSILHQTPKTISFLSIDFPFPAEKHILIIPKKHYVNLEDCPKSTQSELIEHVALASRAIRLEHQGCNILLNDGRSAEQSVMHTHFHVVPRDDGDNIEIELWKRVNVSEKKYAKLNKEVKELFKKAKKR
ncbi:MAG: HIT domain-containing protein [Candidatus Diapherotrites archaeon]|jgi:histidine triad (HIT) family protein|uniref:HIT domain-containing protein n=1 Tax=Candidatus Iainarchaeum sp. TaxID=3101447 RepID=A0A8T5GG07_9ARCH|nr:HIT domain-containing protein [Candidatus Diapherotrites archaeon]